VKHEELEYARVFMLNLCRIAWREQHIDLQEGIIVLQTRNVIDFHGWFVTSVCLGEITLILGAKTITINIHYTNRVASGSFKLSLSFIRNWAMWKNKMVGNILRCYVGLVINCHASLTCQNDMQREKYNVFTFTLSS